MSIPASAASTQAKVPYSYWIAVLLLSLAGCAGKAPPAEVVTLTFKSDHSQFTGTVIRREAHSISVMGQGGEAHTFLYSELADIGPATSASPQGNATQSTSASNSVATPASPGTPGAAISLPEGSTLLVTANSFVDSTYAPTGGVGLGSLYSDVKSSDGKTLIPAGANIAFAVREKKLVSNRLQMDLEIASADFTNRHYVVSPAKNGTDPGAVASFTGAEANSKEAVARGTAVHIDSGSVITFKAVTPIVFKPSD